MVRPGTLTSRPHHEGGRVSLATRKRYHTALGGLASRLVKRGLIDEHFIRDTGEDLLYRFAEFEDAAQRWLALRSQVDGPRARQAKGTLHVRREVPAGPRRRPFNASSRPKRSPALARRTGRSAYLVGKTW